MKQSIYYLGFLILLSCNSSVSPVVPKIGEKFELAFNQKVTIPSEDIEIEFSDVLEDSRCPEGAACFWAGNAEIVAVFNDNEIHLNTYLEPKKVDLSGYNIALISLVPYPKINQEIKKEEYTATLLVTKN
ncbi:hypothetical protein NC796_11900 [Aliifodinibius sp. S!AR15-10]|uniref:hypothetical protein n=1 Tax=Aliifodinibius sp. S!AR15-10 TaxID=2950437 RepID=UPI002863010B|nr:hypothetical protein [Aliifodinibius sp. S!AR15-10]MDR8391851.1 hypothetical protein [Aliifodinibius sp. S!AR15-10]